MKLLLVLLACILPLSAFAETPTTKTKLYAYETAETVPMGAVFGGMPLLMADDELLSVNSPIAQSVEIHSMQDENGVMKMRKVDSLSVPKDGMFMLVPTGYHIMLIKLTAPLKEGQTFPLTMNFKNAGPITVDVPVISRKAN